MTSARLSPSIAASETPPRDVLGEEGGMKKHLSPGRFGLFSAPRWEGWEQPCCPNDDGGAHSVEGSELR